MFHVELILINPKIHKQMEILLRNVTTKYFSTEAKSFDGEKMVLERDFIGEKDKLKIDNTFIIDENCNEAKEFFNYLRQYDNLKHKCVKEKTDIDTGEIVYELKTTCKKYYKSNDTYIVDKDNIIATYHNKERITSLPRRLNNLKCDILINISTYNQFGGGIKAKLLYINFKELDKETNYDSFDPDTYINRY